MTDPAHPSVDMETLDRYLAGESSLAETELVGEWLTVDSTHREIVRALRTVLPGEQVEAKYVDVGRAWSAFQKDVQQVGVRRSTQRGMRTVRERGFGRIVPRQTHSHVVGLAAAMLAVAIGLVVTRKSDIPIPKPRVAVHEYATSAGQHAMLTLPDGSVIRLAPATRVRYTDTFGASAREVELSGAALFTIVHSEHVPFLVHARGTITRDLGTTFAVRSYAADLATQVIVAEGKVSVHNIAGSVTASTQAPTVLGAGDMARVTRAGTLTVVHDIDVDKALGWMDDRLSFDHVLFRDAIPDLEREYDLKIQVADSAVAEHRFTASFSRQTTEEVLSTLALVLNANVTRRGRVVTFATTKHPASHPYFREFEIVPDRMTAPSDLSGMAHQVALRDSANR